MIQIKTLTNIIAAITRRIRFTLTLSNNTLICIIVSSCHYGLDKCITLFVSVALISFVLYLRKIPLEEICILYCLVPLNSILFKPCLLMLL